MENNTKNETLSRRSFFKKAAGTALSVAALTIIPNVFTSCEIEVPDVPGGTTSCGGVCKNTCQQTCSSDCTANCRTQCKSNSYYHPSGCSLTSCKNACQRTCSGTCYANASR